MPNKSCSKCADHSICGWEAAESYPCPEYRPVWKVWIRQNLLSILVSPKERWTLEYYSGYYRELDLGKVSFFFGHGKDYYQNLFRKEG